MPGSDSSPAAARCLFESSRSAGGAGVVDEFSALQPALPMGRGCRAARSLSCSPTSRARPACCARTGRAYGTALADHRRLLRAAFAASGGREVDTQGDSFFVAFPTAEQAVAAAAGAALAGRPVVARRDAGARADGRAHRRGHRRGRRLPGPGRAPGGSDRGGRRPGARCSCRRPPPPWSARTCRPARRCDPPRRAPTQGLPSRRAVPAGHRGAAQAVPAPRTTAPSGCPSRRASCWAGTPTSPRCPRC